MTNDERIENLEGKYSDLHTVVNILAAKVDATNNKVDNLISEIRDRDNQRHAEITAINQQNAEIRQSIREIYQTTDAKIADIKNSVDGIAKHVQNFSIAAFVGIGAMVVTSVIGIAAMVWAVIPKG